MLLGRRAWKEARFLPIELTKVFRQTDSTFVDLLAQLRLGIVTDECRSAPVNPFCSMMPDVAKSIMCQTLCPCQARLFTWCEQLICLWAHAHRAALPGAALTRAKWEHMQSSDSEAFRQLRSLHSPFPLQGSMG